MQTICLGPGGKLQEAGRWRGSKGPKAAALEEGGTFPAGSWGRQ